MGISVELTNDHKERGFLLRLGNDEVVLVVVSV